MFGRKKKPTLKVLFVDLDVVNSESSVDELYRMIGNKPIAVVHSKNTKPFIVDTKAEVRTA